jgi:hypothetical protein
MTKLGFAVALIATLACIGTGLAQNTQAPKQGESYPAKEGVG